MGQVIENIRVFCRETRGLGAADRERIRGHVVTLTDQLLSALEWTPEQAAVLAEATRKRLSAGYVDWAGRGVSTLEAVFAAVLTAEERSALTSVPMHWELISNAICVQARGVGAESGSDQELAHEFLETIGFVQRLMEAMFLSEQGERLELVAIHLGQRLGLAEGDARLTSAIRTARCLQVAAVDQMEVVRAVHFLYLTARRGSDPDFATWALLTIFRPRQALENVLQQYRRERPAAERGHLDQVSLLLAWDDLLQLPWGEGGLWFDQVTKAVDHHLREAYRGEAGRPEKELPTSPADLEPTPDKTLPDMLGDDLSPLEQLAPYLEQLPRAQRAAVSEYLEAVSQGRITLWGKQDDSLRQLWSPEEYDRKRRALNRGLRRLRKQYRTGQGSSE